MQPKRQVCKNSGGGGGGGSAKRSWRSRLCRPLPFAKGLRDAGIPEPCMRSAAAPSGFRQRIFLPMAKAGGHNPGPRRLLRKGAGRNHCFPLTSAREYRRARSTGPRRQGRRLVRGALPPGRGRRKPGPIIYGAGRLLSNGAGRNHFFHQRPRANIAVRVGPRDYSRALSTWRMKMVGSRPPASVRAWACRARPGRSRRRDLRRVYSMV